MKKLLAALVLVALTFPLNAMASTAEGAEEEEFNPEHEFELAAWVPIEIGPIDMSINKAVVYLWLGAGVAMALGILLMRLRVRVDPTTRQTAGETIYDIVQTQIAEQGLPHRAIGRWFPFVATLFLFVWSLNMLGFLPLPLTGETYEVAGLEIPVWGIYAATSSISVTLALALMTFVFTHVEGVRENGPVRYVKSWIPEVPRALVGPIALIEVLSQFMRLVSLSVRLYANMLAGHMLILTFIGLIFVAGTAFSAIGLVPLATIFYLFEVIIVVNIQAFIFAALSAIYIGSAIEPEH
jgi:F-type H+-transporting ATPase subunit a